MSATPVDEVLRAVVNDVVYGAVYSLVGSVASVTVSFAVYWPMRDAVDWDVGRSVKHAIREEIDP